MIYLDYSATTPVNKDVLDSFNKTCIEFVGNSNSLHKLGVASNQLQKAATKQIADIFCVKENEIIYTSGSSESNNFAIKGIAHKYQNRGKHIITTKLEHSSIIEPLNYLKKQGFEVNFVNIKPDGLVDMNHLKSLLRTDTTLVTICTVDSELGIRQPVEEIAAIIKGYKNCFFHTDATQAIGKIKIDFSNIDLVSFSSHKFYGMKGFGGLIKKEKILIEPLIHGGKSTTIYRSGTPSLPMIVSTAKALRLAYENLDENINNIKDLNKVILNKLKTYNDLVINSNINSLPNVINFSLLNIKPETFVHALEEYEIYVSTKSACSSTIKISESVLAITGNNDIASSSLRISLSHLTTIEEISKFLEIFDICYNKLK